MIRLADTEGYRWAINQDEVVSIRFDMEQAEIELSTGRRVVTDIKPAEALVAVVGVRTATKYERDFPEDQQQRSDRRSHV